MKEQEQEAPLAEVQEAPVVEVQEEVTPEETGPVATKDEDGTFKLDLTSAIEKPESLVETEAKPTVEPVAEADEPEEFQALEEITEEEVVEQAQELQEEIEEAVQEQVTSGIDLPENIQKVVEFINETGGDLEDYVKLNTDYSLLNEEQLLKEYYASTKKHLSKDDVDFLMEDNFTFDEELDDEREVRRKKLAWKEELLKAKNHLDSQKNKYYEEIKAGSKLNPEQQKAVSFFDRYNKEQEQTTKLAEKQKSAFLNKTNTVFNKDFKGFDYSVGDKKYRFNVKNADEVKSSQSDINNFIKKFLNDKNEISDAKGYHKSLFTANNPDMVAQHFYEQGKADAVKDVVAKSKNTSLEARSTAPSEVTVGGFKVRAISGVDSSKLKIKKTFNN